MEAATSETIYTSQLPANILMLIFSDDLLYLFNINAGQYLVAFLFYFIMSVFVIFFFGQHERAKNKHHIPVLFQPKLMMFVFNNNVLVI